MKTEYMDIITKDNKQAVLFDIVTRRGNAYGLFCDDTIFVHLIKGEHCVNGIMNILINKFKTNKIVFTPLINDNIKKSLRGEIKIFKKDSPGNPYQEDFEYMEVIWD